MDSKGSWMVFNKKTLNLAFLTNYDDWEFKEVINPEFRRGQLTKSFGNLDKAIESNEELSAYFENYLDNKDEFNGCNLVYMNLFNWLGQYASTHYEGDQPVLLECQKVYSITNNSLSENEWPKQREGIEIIQKSVIEINNEFQNRKSETEMVHIKSI